MRSVSSAVLCTGALALCWAGVAAAAPADILIILDTSASMSAPSGLAGGQTKLDLAREVIGRITESAERRGNRVGLMRFKQASRVVRAGEGERVVVSEDHSQCRTMVDLLVPVDTVSAPMVRRWTDGIADDSNPEVEALGDSPLYGSIQVGLRFIRGMRLSFPQRHCVNAFLVVLTDGEDTCAAGGELQTALAELSNQSLEEDIRAYVLAVDPSAEAANLIADLGHEAPEAAAPFGFDRADELLAVIDRIRGRLAPAACLVSGVPPESLQSSLDGPPTPEGVLDPGTRSANEDDGCAQSPPGRGPPTGLVLLAAFVFGLRLRRRLRLPVLILLALGCEDDTSERYSGGGVDIPGL